MSTQKRKPQRPSDKKEIALPIIIEALEANVGRIRATESAGIAYHTFLSWLDSDCSFCTAIKKAETKALQKGKEYAIQAIFKHMSSQWTAAAWWLERKFPEEFAKRESNSQGYEGDKGKILAFINGEVKSSSMAPKAVGGEDAGD